MVKNEIEQLLTDGMYWYTLWIDAIVSAVDDLTNSVFGIVVGGGGEGPGKVEIFKINLKKNCTTGLFVSFICLILRTCFRPTENKQLLTRCTLNRVCGIHFFVKSILFLKIRSL